MKSHKTVLNHLGTILCLGLLYLLLVNGASVAQDHPPFMRLVQEMKAEKTALSNPAAVTFSTRANAFYAVESAANSDSPTDSVAINKISVFSHKIGTININVRIDNPINMVMDNNSGRLLIYQSSTRQLVGIAEDPTGDLDANSISFYDGSYIDISDPQGMAFDPIHDYLYMLDSVGPRLVRIALPPDGSLTTATVETVELAWAGQKVLRGIAYDPTSANLSIVSPNERKLYEVSDNGVLVSTRDLSEYNLSNPQGLVFAPSADQTDDPREYSLYLADSGNQPSSQMNSSSEINLSTLSRSGKIVELSFVQPAAQIDADFPSTPIKVTETSEFSPPSPDPSGLTYLASSNTLLISDADVDETVSGMTHFMGANLWEVSLSGTVIRTANISLLPYPSNSPSPVPMTNEPTGVAWNPGNGHYYVTDDNSQAVFDLNPGIDGILGSADDSWTKFLTILENGDPEGIAYDSWHDLLYVIDGTNVEVYVYTLSGTYLNHFDVEAIGALDTESIEFNPISGTFFILSNLSSNKIFEIAVDTSPVLPDPWTVTLINTIDFSIINPKNPAGLAYAPASDGSGEQRFYIIDRGYDNDYDPNENDGMLYEMTAPSPSLPVNKPPIVNAGVDQTIALEDEANLIGAASDDGNPNPPAAITTQWSVTSGPGPVVFGTPASLTTTASFSVTGTYALRLTASDGEFSTYDEMNINVTHLSGSSILEERVLESSDDAEEGSGGVIDLDDVSLKMTWNSAFNQTVGMRFLGVNLPKNALINYAYIQFHNQKFSDVATSLTVWGEDQDNPGTFTSATSDISSRIKTSSAANWNPPPWTVVYSAGVEQRTSDITSILQELISRPGWTSGNSMAFIIEGTGLRYAWSFDGHHYAAPRLHVEYTISSNHAPVAVNDAYSTNEDTQLVVAAGTGVLVNDSDDDLDPLTAYKYTDPLHGTLTFNSDGSFTYMPAPNYYGSDSFTYYVFDNHFNSNLATVNLTVNPVNDAPVAVNDAYTTNEDTPLVVPAPGVLGNDTDADLNTLTVSEHSTPSHGSLTINSNGSFTYTPAANYHGPDSFTYRANDGTTNSNLATVSLTITSVNDAPVAVNDAYTTNEDTPLVVPAPGVLGNDTDADLDTLTVSEHSTPSHGTLTINSNGSFTYTPNLNYHGPDSFTYRANDGTINSNLATVSLTVTSVNDVPVAVNDAYTTNEDTPLVVPAPGVLGNDTDADLDTLTVSEHSTPLHGTLTINSNGSFTYTPGANYHGPDSFTYRANDGTINSNLATVSLTVTSVNDVPVAVNDTYTTDEDTPLVVPTPGVLGNDTDADLDTLTVSEHSTPSHGTLTINSNGSFTYTPALNYYGSDSFTYRAGDGTDTSGLATVSITINSINDAPSVVNDAYTTDEDTPLDVTVPGVLSNDSDAEGDSISIAEYTYPSHGELYLNLDGSFLYIPDHLYHGTDSFTYVATDGSKNSTTATVNITVRHTIFIINLPFLAKYP